MKSHRLMEFGKKPMYLLLIMVSIVLAPSWPEGTVPYSFSPGQNPHIKSQPVMPLRKLLTFGQEETWKINPLKLSSKQEENGITATVE